MVNYNSEYFDKFVKESEKNLEDIYYSKCIEHEENLQKVFSLMSANPDAVILDAGCGVGNFVIPLSYQCKFAYGIDNSKESIRVCEERLAQKGIKNVSVRVASITKIPLENNSVDKIVCFGVLQYLNFIEIDNAIKEFKRVLKENGLLVIGFLNSSSPHGISTQFIRLLRRIIKGKKEYSFTNIPYNKLKKIIKNEKGVTKLLHSAYFYPVLFPKKVIDFISKRFYYEKFFPMFLKKYGLSLLIGVRFTK